MVDYKTSDQTLFRSLFCFLMLQKNNKNKIKTGMSLSAVVENNKKKEENIQPLNQRGKCVTLKQRLGAGHGTIMGKRSMFLESLHRQPCTVFERDDGWNGRGKQKDAIGRANGGRDVRLIFPKRSCKYAPWKQSGTRSIVARILEGQITRDVPIKSHLPML